jgi:hypothetical protein
MSSQPCENGAAAAEQSICLCKKPQPGCCETVI